ncbi:hypothetical protein Tco_1359775 [Tanacetum coccineum]
MRISIKRSKAGKRFGFVRFINVFNEERLVMHLMNRYVWAVKLHANSNRDKVEWATSYVQEVKGNNTSVVAKVIIAPPTSEASKKLFHSNVGIGSWFSQLIQASKDFTIEGRIVWVEIEGDLNAVDSDVDEVLETCFEERSQNYNKPEELSTGQKENHSKDPFNIYELLNKKKDNVESEDKSEHSPQYPPGYTPKDGWNPFVVIFNGYDPNSKRTSWVKWKNVLAFKERKEALEAIHGEDGKVGKQVKSTFPSYWMDIVHEINVLKNQGVVSNRSSTKLYWFPPQGPRTKPCSLVSRRWKWSLENSGDFSVASVRKMLDDKMLPDVTTKTRWIKLVPIKVNVHAWKVKIDSLTDAFSNISRKVWI